MARKTYVCDGDDFPGARGPECPHPLHGHPLPYDGTTPYVTLATRRRDAGWKRAQCPECGEYGWTPPTEGTHDGP